MDHNTNTPIDRPMLQWRDGNVPVDLRFDDPYFSLGDGLAETRHVFLAGNNLPDRFAPGFQIAELGFGTGLNLLASWAAWRDSAQVGQLHFTSFEAYPMHIDDMAHALSRWAQLSNLAKELIALLRKEPYGFDTNDLRFELIIGDARQTLPNWAGQADAWFLDGFSPAKNPQLWGGDLMRALYARTKPHGSFATYSASGFVRRNLRDAGFSVARVPGFGRKRHMSQGIRQ